MRPRIPFLLFSLFAFGIVCVAAFSYYISRPMPIPEVSRTFVVTSGESVKAITGNLIESGVDVRDFWFRTYVWLAKKESSFIAGSFELPAEASIEELVRIFTERANRETRTIKLLEGWSSAVMADYLASEEIFTGGEFVELLEDEVFFAEVVALYPVFGEKPASASLEGFLFPDTYQIFADANAKDVALKMFANFNQKVTPDLRQEIERQGKSFYDVLIMASIIEAEVPHEEDRTIVSDIFWSRLALGVALQSDATLKYVIGGKRPALTFEELAIDSPYNSYKYRGLPPTPIDNPGLSAIRAAIYPAHTDYFYFLSTPAGETIFSRTLDEHNAAKARYLR